MGSTKTSLSSNEFRTIVLSAGLGTRFRPHTNILAKPAIPFLNVPFLFYSTHLAECLGATRIAINTFHLPKTVKDLMLKLSPSESKAVRTATYVTCEEAPTVLGSAGGIRNLRSELEGFGNFLVLNADTVFLIQDLSFFKLLQRQHASQKALATLVLTGHPEAGRLYNAVWINDRNEVVGIGKTPPESQKRLRGLHYTGVQWLSDDVFRLIPEGVSDIFRDVLLPQIAKGQKVLGYEVQGFWFEGGSLDGYLKETERALMILSQVKLSELKDFNGNDFLFTLFSRFWPNFKNRKTLIEHQNGATVLIGDQCEIDASAEFNGFVVLGNNVRVGKNVKLENVVVKDKLILMDGFSASNQLILS